MSSLFLVALCFVSTVRSVAMTASQQTALVAFLNASTMRIIDFNATSCPSVATTINRVACNAQGEISQLMLSHCILTGSISELILQLSQLTLLNLSDNLLQGSVEILGRLTNLQTLDVSYNALTGDALGMVANLPLLQTCVLQQSPPLDTNCFPGQVWSNATLCASASQNPLNLCDTYIPRTTTSTSATTTSSTTTTSRLSTTTKSPVTQSLSTTTTSNPATSSSAIPSTISATSAPFATLTTTSSETDVTQSTTTKPVTSSTSNSSVFFSSIIQTQNTTSAQGAVVGSPAYTPTMLGLIVVSLVLACTSAVIGVYLGTKAFMKRKYRNRETGRPIKGPSRRRQRLSSSLSDCDTLEEDEEKVEPVKEKPSLDPSSTRAAALPPSMVRASSEYTSIPFVSQSQRRAEKSEDQKQRKRSLRSRQESLKRPPPFAPHTEKIVIPPVLPPPAGNYDRITVPPLNYSTGSAKKSSSGDDDEASYSAVCIKQPENYHEVRSGAGSDRTNYAQCSDPFGF